MQEVTIEIAQVAIAFKAHRLTLDRDLLPFIRPIPPHFEVFARFQPLPRFKQKRKLYQRGKAYSFFRTEKGFWVAFDSVALGREFKKTLADPVLECIPKGLLIFPDLKKAIFFLGTRKKKEPFRIVWPYIYLLLSHMLLYRRRGIFVHAAAIRTQGKGCLFVGPSGAGKSTLASLFRRDEKTIVLGDDFMTVRKERNQVSIYGTAVFSSPRFFPPQKGTPLEGIFFLRHGKRNHLKLLSSRASFERFLRESPQIFWIPEANEFSTRFALDLCEQLPTYEFSFTPNAKAVLFLKKTFPRLRKKKVRRT